MRHNPRHLARRYALQALYQWQLTKDPTHEIEAQFYARHIENKKVDREYFRELFHACVDKGIELDECIAPHTSRKPADIDPTERAILRIAIYEFKEHIEVPYKVVINEALELAKLFGAPEGFKFINGVLDKAARDLRAAEIQAKQDGAE